MSDIISNKNNNYFKAGTIAKSIIERHIKGKNSTVITDELNTELNTQYFTKEKIESIISKYDQKNDQKNSIKLQFGIYNPEKHKKIFRKIGFLFDNRMLAINILIFILLTFYCFYKTNIFSIKEKVKTINYFEITSAYILTYLILFIHELGHTIAAIRHNIIPKKIGFGFYFVIPVLFTDLSEIWKLNKKNRIIINLGGVYFQLLLGICFYILSLIFKIHIFDYLIIINITIAFNVFNPIFKYDGYWIYSDFFEIPNLRAKSNEYIINLVKNRQYKNKLSLIIYSILTISFTFFQLFILIIFSKNNFKLIQNLNENKYIDTIKLIFYCIINIFFIYIFIRKIFNYLITKNETITRN